MPTIEENRKKIENQKKQLARAFDLLKAQENILNAIKMRVKFKKEHDELSEKFNKLSELLTKRKAELEKTLTEISKYENPGNAPPDGDPDLEHAVTRLATEVSSILREIAKYAETQKQFQRELQAAGYRISNNPSLDRKRAAEDSIRPAKGAAGEPEWATEKIVEQVKEKLRSLGQKRQDALHVLTTEFENYQRTQPGSADRVKCEAIVKAIVTMPGWGYVPLSKRDQRVYISRDEAEHRKEEVLHRIAEKNLAGTEEIIMPILESYFEIWDRMVATPPTTNAGDPIPDSENLLLPVFCIDGPPGVGKTTIVNAIAEALDMPSEYVRTQGVSAGGISGYTRQYGTPKPSLVTTARTTKGNSSAVILLDELDKAERATQDAVGGIAEKSEPEVRDEYLEINVEKGFNLMIATTNNYSLLPDHIQSRMQKIYFGGYTDDQKVAILKNKTIGLIGPRYSSIQFLSKGGDSDPKQYKVVHTEKGLSVTKKVDSNCFVAPEGDDQDIDAIRYLVENYITEAGIREADALLQRIISRASNEFNSHVREKSTKDSISLEEAAKVTPPIKIDEAIIHRALGKPDQYIKPIKELNNAIIGKNKKFSEASEKLGNLIEDIEALGEKGRKDKSEELMKTLQDFEKEKAELITLETQLIKTLEKRHRRRGLDSAVKRDIADQIKQHQGIVSSINENSENLISKANLLLGKTVIEKPVEAPPEKERKSAIDKPDLGDDPLSPESEKPSSRASEPPTKDEDLKTELDNLDESSDLEIGRAKGPTIKSPPTPFMPRRAERSPTEEGEIESKSREEEFHRESSKGAKISVGGSRSLFFKHGVVAEIEKHPKLVISTSQPLTQEIFANVAKALAESIETLKQTLGLNPDDAESFKDLTVYKKNENLFSMVKNEDEIMTIKHLPKSVEIESVTSDPKDDELYAMVLAAKIAAQKLGKDQFTIEHCEGDPQTAFKMFLIGKSMGLTPKFKPGHTVQGIITGEFAERILTPGGRTRPKTIADIYKEVDEGNIEHDQLKRYIAQLEYSEDSPRRKL